MSPFEKLADLLVAEVPITRLQSLFGEDLDSPTIGMGGGLCGLGCDAGYGNFCGFSCRPPGPARSVIDPYGRLGLTTKDLIDIRSKLPQLRQSVIHEVEAHLDKLR